MDTDQGTVTDQGTGNSNNLGWRAGLPDEFKEHDWAKTHSNVGDFFREALGVKTEHDSLKTKMEGAIFKPGEDATKEDWDSFYGKFGRPESPDKYEFKDIEWPEDVEDWLKEASESDINDFRETFHKLGLSTAQAQGLIDKVAEQSLARWNEGQSAIQKKQDEAKETLQKEWKDDFKGNTELAKRGAEMAGEMAGMKEDFMKFMEDSRLGDNVMFLKVFHAIGKAISEDSVSFAGIRSSNEPEKGVDGRTMLKFPSMQK